MVMRVEKMGETLCVMIPAEAAEALNLREGVAVEVKAANGVAQPSRYISAEEATESYLRTEPLHLNTYRELAK